MYGHDFLSELDCMNYLDDLYNEGVQHEMMLEDHLLPLVYVDASEGEAAIGYSEWRCAQDISDSFCKTWNEIEMLPMSDHEGGRL